MRDSQAYIPDLRLELLIALMVAALLVVVARTGATRGWDDWLHDHYFRMRQAVSGTLERPRRAETNVVYIAIDERSEAALAGRFGSFPYAPEAYRALLAKLLAPGHVPPERIVITAPLDARTMRQEAEGIAELAATMRRGRVWLTATYHRAEDATVGGAPPREWAWPPNYPGAEKVMDLPAEGAVWAAPPRDLVAAAYGGGVAIADPPGVAGSWQTPVEARFRTLRFADLGFVLRNAASIESVLEPRRRPELGDTGALPFDRSRVETDERGVLPVNFAGPTREAMPTYSMADVLNMTADEVEERMGGNATVVIGVSLRGVAATVATPYGARLCPLGEAAAHAIRMHLYGQYLRPVNARAGWLLAVAVALGLGVGMHAQRPMRGLAFTLGVVFLLFIGGLLFFLNGWLMPFMLPMVAAFAIYAAEMSHRVAREERRRRNLQHRFMEYLSTDLVMQIMDAPDGVSLEGELLEVTILLADLRGFTSWASQHSALEVIAQLNEFLGAMSRIIEDHGGTVDKFMGDEVMAIFGAPAALEHPARNAVAAALEMQERLADMGRQWAMEGRKAFQMGVAIHTGEAVVGEIGAEVRRNYTAIGSMVNLTARLEEKTKEFCVGTLITHATREQAGAQFEYREVGAVELRDIPEPVLVYEVLGRRRAK